MYVSTLDLRPTVRTTRTSHRTLNPSFPQTCKDVRKTKGTSRPVVVLADGFEVMCDTRTDGGGWTVIQRRVDGTVNFTRNWQDYKYGFGDFDNGEFYLGNENIHLITSLRHYEMRVDMVYKDKRKFASYSMFRIYGEPEDYKLIVGGYSGSAGDSLSPIHNNMKFSTYDRDNDAHSNNCAMLYKGGWWYNACHTSNLNGIWGIKEFGRGVNWNSFTGFHASANFTEMKIRPIH